MEFFDIFIFNNVKSDLKIILFLPNQVVFKVKSVIFVKSIPIPKAPMGRGWADIYIVKGVSDALVLTIRELRKLICQSRTKQQETSHGCIVYSPYWLRLHFAFVAKKGYLYTYTYVGLSALLVSDWQGNAKAYESWNEWQTGSTFFYFVYSPIKNNPAVVARQSS